MNPEFQRNLWLEASPRRIAWAAVTLVLIYGAVVLVARHYPGGVPRALSLAGAAVFVVCAVFWGARAAGNSVLAEIAERTWDFQRLSALTPWSMTWGKLAGAASLAWLCALTGVVLYAAGAPASGAGWNLLFLVALAGLFQALSLGAALIGVRKARAEGRIARAGGVLGGLIIGVLLLSAVAGSSGFQHGAGVTGLGRLFGDSGLVDWWGGFPPAERFRALSMLAFAAFALAGAWRLMRLELQMRNAPLVWPAFLVFLAVWVAGFAYRAGGLAGSLVAAALAVSLAAYAAAFAEPADRVRLRKFVSLARRGAFAEAAQLAPASLIPFVFAVLLVAAAAFAARGAQGGEVAQAAALVAFVLRDLGVIALFRFGPRPQRGDFGAVVALAILYGVGSIVGGTLAGAAGTALFVPNGLAPGISLASALVQAAIAWFLAIKRIRAPETSVSAPPSDPASAPA